MINKIWKDKNVFVRKFSKVIDDFVKSQSANRIPKTTIKSEGERISRKVMMNELFLLDKSKEGIKFQFPKLNHSLLIRNSDLQILKPYKEKIKSFSQLELYCDGTSRQKVIYYLKDRHEVVVEYVLRILK